MAATIWSGLTLGALYALIASGFASAAGSADAVDDENERDGVEHPARMTAARRPKVAEGAKQVGAANEQARVVSRRVQTFTRYLSKRAGLAPNYQPSRRRSLPPISRRVTTGCA